MSDYKHGNWYCKPANEAEAKEIIERAVASGAKRKETPDGWSWDTYGAWGVRSGRTHTQTLVFYRDCNFTEYTIEQVRELFPLAGERKQWNDEGLPPVGTEVEYTAVVAEHSRCILPGSWYRGTVIAYHDGAVWTSDNGIRQLSNTVFRPVRTERERWVEAAHKIANDGGGFAASMLAIGALYDALKSGDLKAPEVE